MRRQRNGFCPQAAHRPRILPRRELASAARAVFISITTAEVYGLGGARQPCFQESARRKGLFQVRAQVDTAASCSLIIRSITCLALTPPASIPNALSFRWGLASMERC